MSEKHAILSREERSQAIAAILAPALASAILSSVQDDARRRPATVRTVVSVRLASPADKSNL